jgi:DNA-binding XRE family transcriptional regulator
MGWSAVDESSKEEKYLTRRETARLVRVGELVKPERCGQCGELGDVQAHHRTYQDPRAIDWLCLDCHTDAHRPHTDSGLPNLRALRKGLDLTQAELAQRADVTQATISDLESGEQQMANFATLRRLAKALRVSVGDLFEKPSP